MCWSKPWPLPSAFTSCATIPTLSGHRWRCRASAARSIRAGSGRVTDFIETHLGDDLTIEILANEACLSPFHFARAFKAATGTPPHRYLTDRRIGHAKFLIAEGRLPLAEIAGQCGFSSQSHFTRWFKRVVGTTPGAYRMNRR